MNLRMMMVFASIAAVLLIDGGLLAQSDKALQDSSKTQASFSVQVRTKGVDADTIFAAIERGITLGETKLFSRRFARQVSLSLGGDDNAYYSANQSYYILQNYLDSHKVISFKFSLVNGTEGSPYATGGGTLRFRSSLKVFQIYASLTIEDNQLVISQFNLY